MGPRTCPSTPTWVGLGGITSDPPATLICDDVSSTTCDPGTLTYETDYYWQVVATDNHAASTTGDIWDFSTAESAIYIYLPIILKNH
jgi:hypothetical protein